MQSLNIERVCVKWPCRGERLFPCRGVLQLHLHWVLPGFFSTQIEHCLGRRDKSFPRVVSIIIAIKLAKNTNEFWEGRTLLTVGK